MTLNRIAVSILATIGMTVSMICQAAPASEESDNIYTEKKPNIVVTSDRPEFTLKLRANPTTGYSWFLREYNSKLITPIKHSYQPPDTKLIGAGGFDVWTFRVSRTAFLVPQQTALRMVYVRPWQNDSSGAQIVFRVSTQGQ